MEKNALILYCGKRDEYLVKALQQLKWNVVAFSIKDPFNLAPVFQHPHLENRVYDFHQNILNPLFVSKFQISECLKIIRENRISLIASSTTINDLTYLLMGYLNSTCKLPGLNFKMGKFWYKKSRYLKYFKKQGVKTPYIFQILHPSDSVDTKCIVKFPVICKPDCGTGGEGVFLAENSTMLSHFFSPAPKNEKITELQKLHRNRIKNGQLANYLYSNFNSKYIVEEYIQGPLLSVMGIKAVNGVEISLIFEIIPSDPPFRSENEFLAPFPFTDENKHISGKVHQLVSRIVEDPIFPYGPFIFDFILHDNEDLYLLDVSPRLSSTAGVFYRFCYSDFSYETRCIQAILNQKIDIHKYEKPLCHTYVKRLPLPKGTLIHFSQKESFSDYVFEWDFQLKPRDKIYRDRNDFLSKMRGSLGVIGENAQECRVRWDKEFKKLSFVIKEDARAIL